MIPRLKLRNGQADITEINTALLTSVWCIQDEGILACVYHLIEHLACS